MNYIIGIDLGTSGTKTVLFNENGESIADSTYEYEMYQPKNGWAEQNPEDWWDAAQYTLKDVIAKSGVDVEDIKGVGLSGQMHGLVMLDESGQVLRNCIIWCDGRTVEQAKEITEIIGEQRLVEITANPALANFTAAKILWVRENEPEIYDKCRHILLPKDYVRYKLCGELACEVSDASGTNLLDVPNRCWSEEILEKLKIDKTLLPPVYESYEAIGAVTDEASEKTGLKAGTVVVGGAGDNAAAAIGTGVVKSGSAFTTVGTSGVIFAHSDKVTIDPRGRVHTFCSAVPGAWAVMSCTLSAGGSLQWFRNNFCTAEMESAKGLGVDTYEILSSQADRVPIGSNRLIFLPYLMGERSPILCPEARGVFFGLSAMHARQDMLRAVMEGVSYSLRDCLDVIEEMEVPFEEMIITGGGGRSKVWRQMLADMYSYPVKTVQSKEGPALGAAILAGVGSGLFESVESACDSMVSYNPSEQPIEENTREYSCYYKLYKQVYESLKDKFEMLASL